LLLVNNTNLAHVDVEENSEELHQLPLLPTISNETFSRSPPGTTVNPDSFVAADFPEKHPGYSYMKDYLHDMPSQV
jgi:hypothetical protein